MGNKEFFLKRFQHKTIKELQTIVNNKEHFNQSAIEAAQELLKNHKALTTRISEPLKELENQNRDVLTLEKRAITKSSQPFDVSKFLRQYSLRDVLNTGSLALTMLAMKEVVSYYASEPFIYGYINYINLIFMFVCLIFNHIFYKYEHKEKSHYFGRCFNDLIFFLIFAIISLCYNRILNIEIALSGNVIFLLIVIICATLLIELIITLFSMLLRLFKLDIL